MGNRRRVSQMLRVDDAYWGFVNKMRFARWVYASMTLFAMLAIVVAFFDIGAGTEYAPNFLKDKPNLTTTQMNENERLLSWLYVFIPSPVLLGWFVVYFGKFFSLWKIKRLRKARNFRYNLLWASVASAATYAAFLKVTLKMTLNDGPKLRAALIIAVCEFGLIFIEVFEEYRTRKKRHALKRLLKAHEQQHGAGALEELPASHAQGPYRQTQSAVARERELELQYVNRVPGGML